MYYNNHTMRTVSFLQYLVWHDEPQLILMRGLGNDIFVGVATGDYKYFVCETTKKQFISYLNMEIDLKRLFLLPARKRWYICSEVYMVYDAPVFITEIDQYGISPGYYPYDGFFSNGHTEFMEHHILMNHFDFTEEEIFIFKLKHGRDI